MTTFPEIQRIAVLSTAHLTMEDRLALKDHKRLFWPVMSWEHGWMVWVPTDDLQDQLNLAKLYGLGESLIEIIRQAHHAGLQWVRFDSDGPVSESLPVFEDVDEGGGQDRESYTDDQDRESYT